LATSDKLYLPKKNPFLIVGEIEAELDAFLGMVRRK
jgi:hypothetical protein